MAHRRLDDQSRQENTVCIAGVKGTSTTDGHGSARTMKIQNWGKFKM